MNTNLSTSIKKEAGKATSTEVINPEDYEQQIFNPDTGFIKTATSLSPSSRRGFKFSVDTWLEGYKRKHDE